MMRLLLIFVFVLMNFNIAQADLFGDLRKTIKVVQHVDVVVKLNGLTVKVKLSPQKKKQILSWKQIQARLNSLGYAAGIVDGKPGGKTKRAVKKFQQINGLKADGKMGPVTRKTLFSANAKVNIKTNVSNHSQNEILSSRLSPVLPIRLAGKVVEGRQKYDLFADKQGNDYTVSYPDLNCSGVWRRIERAKQLAFKEKITKGSRCTVNGYVTLTAMSDAEYKFKWRRTKNSRVEVQGILHATFAEVIVTKISKDEPNTNTKTAKVSPNVGSEKIVTGGQKHQLAKTSTRRVVTIRGTAGDDLLKGTSGPDVMDGGDGKDTIEGLSGDDFLYAGFDDGTGDRFDGGEGYDTLSIAGSDVAAFAFDIKIDSKGNGVDGFGNVYNSIEKFVASEDNQREIDVITITTGVKNNQILGFSDKATGIFKPSDGSAATNFGRRMAMKISNLIADNVSGKFSVTADDENATIGAVTVENFETIHFWLDGVAKKKPTQTQAQNEKNIKYGPMSEIDGIVGGWAVLSAQITHNRNKPLVYRSTIGTVHISKTGAKTGSVEFDVFSDKSRVFVFPIINKSYKSNRGIVPKFDNMQGNSQKENKIGITGLRPRELLGESQMMRVMGFNGDSTFIRFKQYKPADEAGYGSYDLRSFCTGPIERLANNANNEIDVAKALKTQFFDLYRNYSLKLAARAGFFSDNGFDVEFGKAFGAFSRPAQQEFVNRVAICALLHPKQDIREDLTLMLRGKKRLNASYVAGVLGSSFYQSAELYAGLSVPDILSVKSGSDAAKKKFIELSENSSGFLTKADIKSKLLSMKKFIPNTAPSFMRENLVKVSKRLNALYKSEAASARTALKNKLINNFNGVSIPQNIQPEVANMLHDLSNGRIGNINSENQIILAALSQTILANCGLPQNIKQRAELRVFLSSNQTLALFGVDFSAINIVDAVTKQFKAVNKYGYALDIVKAVGCQDRLMNAISTSIVDIVRATNVVEAETVPLFVRSCSVDRSVSQCYCIARYVEGVYRGASDKPYSRSYLEGILGKNPLLALQMANECRIGAY
ncbi:MAG: peptidoglycan-binding protein [Alphaproteobacteria bacterium]|nr:peptidoglycan-binding protein [Alphaproteobacteria bacterium]